MNNSGRFQTSSQIKWKILGSIVEALRVKKLERMWPVSCLVEERAECAEFRGLGG